MLISLAAVPLIVAYPFMKRITWWPQAFLGVTFNWGILVGYAQVTGGLDLAALLLYAAGIAWTLGYDTIYAHQDKEDDLLIGVKSSALRLGTATPHLARGASTGPPSSSWRWPAWPPARPSSSMLGLVAVAVMLARQIEEIDLDDPADCLARFRANRMVGLLVLAALSPAATPSDAMRLPGLDLGLGGALGDVWGELSILADRVRDRHLRLAVTGLRRSGKTVLITAIVHHLLDAHDLPFLRRRMRAAIWAPGSSAPTGARPSPSPASTPTSAPARHAGPWPPTGWPPCSWRSPIARPAWSCARSRRSSI